MSLSSAICLLLQGPALAVPGPRLSAEDPREILVRLETAFSDSLFEVLTQDPAEATRMLEDLAGLPGAFGEIGPIFRLAGPAALPRSEAFAEQAREVRRRLSARRRIATEASLPPLDSYYKIRLAEGTDPRRAIEGLSASTLVRWAGPNGWMFSSSGPLPAFPYEEKARAGGVFPPSQPLPPVRYIPNDPYVTSDQRTWRQDAMFGFLQTFPDLWGHQRTQVLEAWDRFQDPQTQPGAGIVVAVTDTGIDYNHPDLAANIWTNPGETPGNGLDDDGNGFVDDFLGWDFVGPDAENPQPDNDPMDTRGHGTHVAGTIAARGNNALGIVGLAPNAKLMALKVLDDYGTGDFEQVAQGIVYAAQEGADVLNASLGCNLICGNTACQSIPVIEDAVRFAHGLGAAVVFSAGNDNCDVALYSPQNMAETITVAASGVFDRRSFFSNFGDRIDVAAPGGALGSIEPPLSEYCDIYNVLSLRAQLNAIECAIGPTSLDVGPHALRLAGTSMAAPHVAGLCALLLSANPNLGNEDVRQILHASADDIEDPGFDVESGHGRINARRAIGIAIPRVGTPRARRVR